MPEERPNPRPIPSPRAQLLWGQGASGIGLIGLLVIVILGTFLDLDLGGEAGEVPPDEILSEN